MKEPCSYFDEMGAVMIRFVRIWLVYFWERHCYGQPESFTFSKALKRNKWHQQRDKALIPITQFIIVSTMLEMKTEP